VTSSRDLQHLTGSGLVPGSFQKMCLPVGAGRCQSLPRKALHSLRSRWHRQEAGGAGRDRGVTHNPEVAGSNPAPATEEVQVRGPVIGGDGRAFDVNGSRMAAARCAALPSPGPLGTLSDSPYSLVERSPRPRVPTATTRRIRRTVAGGSAGLSGPSRAVLCGWGGAPRSSGAAQSAPAQPFRSHIGPISSPIRGMVTAAACRWPGPVPVARCRSARRALGGA